MAEIIYRCPCMVEEVSLDVPERREEEDVVWWLENVAMAAVYLDHRKRSPACRSTKTDYVKIAAPENATFLGADPKLQS